MCEVQWLLRIHETLGTRVAKVQLQGYRILCTVHRASYKVCPLIFARTLSRCDFQRREKERERGGNNCNYFFREKLIRRKARKLSYPKFDPRGGKIENISSV